MISTKGRYALRVMLDLAQHDGAPYVPLKEIAAPAGYVLSTELSNGISVTIDATTEKQIAFTNTTIRSTGAIPSVDSTACG